MKEGREYESIMQRTSKYVGRVIVYTFARVTYLINNISKGVFTNVHMAITVLLVIHVRNYKVNPTQRIVK